MTDLNTGTKQCTNCKQDINLASFLMHEPFCFKNIILCDQCEQPYNKNQKEDHFKEYHEPIKCECGESIEKMHLQTHKLELCRKRQKECFYCELSLDSDQFDNHIEFCGNRTVLCTKCSRYIKIKDYNKHEDSNCSYPEAIKTNARPKQRQPAATSSVNANTFNDRPNSVKSLDKNYLNQFVRETSRVSLSMLPCEFCNEFYSSCDLLKHQNLCDLNPALACYQTDYEAGSSSNLNRLINQNLRISPSQASRDAHSDNEDASEEFKIPCEFCNRLFDFDAIAIHQPVCSSSSEHDTELNQLMTEYDAPRPPTRESTTSKKSNGPASRQRQSISNSSSNIIQSRQEEAKPLTKLRVKREKSPFFNSFNSENSPTGNSSKLNPTVSKKLNNMISNVSQLNSTSRPTVSTVTSSTRVMGSIQPRVAPAATRTRVTQNEAGSKLPSVNARKPIVKPKKTA